MNPVAARFSADPLGQFALFRSNDLDETRQIVASKFCEHRLDQTRAGERLGAVHNHAQGLAISLNYLRYGAEVCIEPGYLERFYLVQIPLKGHAEIWQDHQYVASHSKTASLLNPHLHTRMRWSADCEHVLVQIDRARIHALAETLLGYRLRDPITFAPQLALSHAQAQHWVSNIAACFKAAEARQAFGDKASGLAQPIAEEALLIDLLRFQPSNVQHIFSARPLTAGNRYVRRAQAYIHANLKNPIGAEEIAQAAGTSLRNLQYGFQDQLGCSPLAYLKRERLNFAHMQLSRGDPSETVASIATRAGFSHLSRFAQAYQKQFGHLPSEARKRQRLM